MANAKRVNMEMQNSANTADVENVVAKISIGTQPVEKAEKLSVGVATKSTRSQTKPQKTITEFSEDLERHYQFYRALVKNNIFNMTSVTDQRIISTWVHACDVSEDQPLKCGFIQLLLVSLQNPGGNIKIFKHSAPKQLPYLVNTPKSLSDLLDTMLYDSDSDESENDEANARQTVCAAVSTDLTSMATTFADENCVQVFYARSDHVVNTWRLPDHVQFPVKSRSSSAWERALSTSPMTRGGNPLQNSGLTKSKTSTETTSERPVFFERSLMEKKCQNIMSEQIGLSVENSFHWYEHSQLDGSLRPVNDISVDKDTSCHVKNQLELDERAFNVVNRLYPGRIKMVLNPRLIREVIGIGVNSIDEKLRDLKIHRKPPNIDEAEKKSQSHPRSFCTPNNCKCPARAIQKWSANKAVARPGIGESNKLLINRSESVENGVEVRSVMNWRIQTAITRNQRQSHCQEGSLCHQCGGESPVYPAQIITSWMSL